jgi:hypothetical protein
VRRRGAASCPGEPDPDRHNATLEPRILDVQAGADRWRRAPERLGWLVDGQSIGVSASGAQPLEML